jgi:hypothetical protein
MTFRLDLSVRQYRVRLWISYFFCHTRCVSRSGQNIVDESATREGGNLACFKPFCSTTASLRSIGRGKRCYFTHGKSQTNYVHVVLLSSIVELRIVELREACAYDSTQPKLFSMHKYRPRTTSNQGSALSFESRRARLQKPIGSYGPHQQDFKHQPNRCYIA